MAWIGLATRVILAYGLQEPRRSVILILFGRRTPHVAVVSVTWLAIGYVGIAWEGNVIAHNATLLIAIFRHFLCAASYIIPVNISE
jgi:hypothetical protein